MSKAIPAPRWSRRGVLAGLILGALALIAVVAYAIIVRKGDVPDDISGEIHTGVRHNVVPVSRGAYLLFHMPHAVTGLWIGGACAVVALALAFVIWRRTVRWPYVAVVLGCGLVITAAWIGRGYVWDIEAAAANNQRWPARSSYVIAATRVAIAITAYSALLAAAAIAAWIAARPRRSSASEQAPSAPRQPDGEQRESGSA